MSGISAARILGLAMAGLAGSMTLPITRAEALTIAPRRAPQTIPTRRYYGISFSYPNGPGWTVAQVKRMAKKAKNRAKHRAHMKGRA